MKWICYSKLSFKTKKFVDDSNIHEGHGEHLPAILFNDVLLIVVF
jgi:hypothetical protein